MDFQTIADSMYAMTCVVSVEKLEGDKHGDIRIVTGNKAYIDSIENPPENMRMLTDKFIPDSLYTNYLTRDTNFEAACYRAAVEKKCVHSYAHPDRFDVWFNMTFMPLFPDDGNICYCTYTMEINFQAESTAMSSGNAEIASSVLDTCIILRGADDFVKAMGTVVKNIREMCMAQHCCVVMVDKLERKVSLLAESLAKDSKLLGIEPYLTDDFYDIADSWEETIAGSNCIIAKNEDEMEIIRERNPEWYKSLTDAMVESIVLFPLKSGKNLLGYMWALNFEPENAGKIKETLEMTTFILGSEIANHLMVDRLRLLSSRDLLTGVMNRNEMNNLVDRLSKGIEEDAVSIGVIFADLNGLKTVNDNEGHSAGDKLLRDAADSLRDVFNEEEIFRAGGDEFCVLIKNISDAQLAMRVGKLRQAADKYTRVSFAIGHSTASNAKNVRTALRHADENMYEDKRIFYEMHPERKQR
ncbi:MAG TPA: GGDEF domain-containing protein [Lachnospiraceae bacterium]|nr:GGDEF domain-containing protein [Lachnospiraceae bacterium]